MADYIVPAHQSDEFDSFNPDDLDIFEENDEIILDENNNQDDSYISEEDEDYIVNESDLDDESEYDSSEDEEPLDKNGKRGTCGGTEDEDEEDEEEDEDDEKTDNKVAQKVKQILSSLDLTPKTLKAKRRKANRSLQQNKIMRLSQVSRNLFTYDGANNIESDDNEKGILFL